MPPDEHLSQHDHGSTMATEMATAGETPPGPQHVQVSTWRAEPVVNMTAPLTEEEEAIIKQVEYYFSDENLPHDAFLLGLCGGKENVPVSISRISGWSKMRVFKPKTKIRNALQKSTLLQVVGDKAVRRKVALSIEPTVEPAVLPGLKSETETKPLISKGMLKPTGFEDNFADPPITPGESNVEQELYDPSVSFETRIETAIQRFVARRKFHSDRALIFERFLTFGGIDTGPKQFGGGLSKADLEDKDATEIAALTARHYVFQHVLDDTKWTVDFSAIAKGFLSSDFIFEMFDASQTVVHHVTGVLANFYRYLLHHDVCPECTDQIRDALEVCEMANEELAPAVQVARMLPDGFGSACSTMFEGNLAGVFGPDQSWEGAEKIGWTEAEAKEVCLVALGIYGTAEQCQEIQNGEARTASSSKDVELEAIMVEAADARAREYYDAARLGKTILQTLGKLQCRRISADLTSPVLPEEKYTFWIEEEVLQHCSIGMTIECEVRTTGSGIQWIDRIRGVNPSYYFVLPNAFYSKEDTATLPKMWYKRLNTIKETGRLPLDTMGKTSKDDGHSYEAEG